MLASAMPCARCWRTDRASSGPCQLGVRRHQRCPVVTPRHSSVWSNNSTRGSTSPPTAASKADWMRSASLATGPPPLAALVPTEPTCFGVMELSALVGTVSTQSAVRVSSSRSRTQSRSRFPSPPIRGDQRTRARTASARRSRSPGHSGDPTRETRESASDRRRPRLRRAPPVQYLDATSGHARRRSLRDAWRCRCSRRFERVGVTASGRFPVTHEGALRARRRG